MTGHESWLKGIQMIHLIHDPLKLLATTFLYDIRYVVSIFLPI